MDEAALNRIVVNSFKSKDFFSYKIPDPQGMVSMSSSKRPFDCFSVTPEYAWYIESKLFKGLSSIPFNAVRDHQYENLLQIERNGIEQKMPIFLFGFWVPRKLFEVLAFRAQFFWDVYQTSDKKSILKKKVQELFERGFSVKIKKGSFDIYELEQRIIDGRNFEA